MIPGFSRNWRRTSSTTAPPARPTASIESEANRQTIMPPRIRPISTGGWSIENVRTLPLLDELLLEAGEEHDRGEHGRADRIALRDGLGRVADRVERVGDVADLLGQVGHLGDAAGVVGDRAEGVERDDQAGQRELPHDRDADAVDPGASFQDDEDPEHEHDRRQRRRLQARPKPWMMFVACPVSEARAVFLTGEKRVEV